MQPIKWLHISIKIDTISENGYKQNGHKKLKSLENFRLTCSHKNWPTLWMGATFLLLNPILFPILLKYFSLQPTTFILIFFNLFIFSLYIYLRFKGKVGFLIFQILSLYLFIFHKSTFQSFDTKPTPLEKLPISTYNLEDKIVSVSLDNWKLDLSKSYHTTHSTKYKDHKGTVTHHTETIDIYPIVSKNSNSEEIIFFSKTDEYIIQQWLKKKITPNFGILLLLEKQHINSIQEFCKKYSIPIPPHPYLIKLYISQENYSANETSFLKMIMYFLSFLWVSSWAFFSYLDSKEKLEKN
jgi:hypothetical protein